MRKKLVLFVMHEFTIGGAQRVVSHLLNNLDRDEFVVHLCLFKKKGPLLEELSEDVVVHDLNARRVITSTHQLIYLIMKLRPDIVFTSITHVNLLLSVFIPLLKIGLKNTLFITREVNIPSIRAKYIQESRRMDYFYKKLINNYDYIIAQSQFMKSDILQNYNVDEKKIKIINNPIDLKAIDKKLKDTESKTYPLTKSDKINILTTGVLRKQKGFDILLKVMTLLDNRYHLNILGEGSERKHLEKMIEELDLIEKVTLLGFHRNPYIYMKDADLIVLSSRYEGFPNVILEANACGKFVIAFGCPGVGSEIIENNVNGLLVECGNYTKLAEEIEKHSLIAHDEAIIKETTARYAVHNIVKEYERLFLKSN
ncbi:MAG: hypothetical protein BV458_04615 [Thermoplasmata archaeon M9B2D]|nr:MAG: hypothetical protein BV458_04615 [Thermoplasmata archaeon M9B2D]